MKTRTEDPPQSSASPGPLGAGAPPSPKRSTAPIPPLDLSRRSRTSLAWIFQGVAAFILGQTLFFKFTAAPESVALFETLGVEPWGRIGSGLVELLAVMLLLVPRTAALGGLLALGVMLGAIGSHLTVLGIEHEGDGGLLFGMAIVTAISGALVAYLRRESLPRRK